MLLDTTFCIDLLRERRRGREAAAHAKLRALGRAPLQMSIFVFCELQHGARLAANPAGELARVDALADLVPVLLPERSFATWYGQAAAHLQRQGLSIPQMDLLIGVHAASLGIPLLTRDAGHFARIDGLAVETY